MTMKVKIYDYNNDTGEDKFSCEAEISECFEADDPELIEVEYELKHQGRAWIGGGASPLRLLMLVR